MKYFKKPNLKNLLLKASKDTAGPSTSKETSVSDFINKPSTSKEVKKATKIKTKRVTKPKKIKSQTDIRKALSKKDEMIYDAINESCNEDGVDPYEMQLALAISESLKDLSKEEQPKKELKETKNFENPFNSCGKITPISTILERYGFKSKRVYSEYEVETFLNSKPRKRGKYQKVPTILTKATDDERELMIRNRINHILDSHLFAYTQESEKKEIAKIERKNPIVYNDSLMEMHELVNTCFRRSSESMVHSDYFITELFEIAHNKPGYLLKDWSKIAGRDPSPERELKRKSEWTALDEKHAFMEITEKAEKQEIKENVNNEIKENKIFEVKEDPKQDVNECPMTMLLSPSSSCSDIFEGIESFSIDELGATKSENSIKAVNEHLELLHEKLSQSTIMHLDKEKLSDKNKQPSVDLTQDESTNSDSTQEYIYDPVDFAEHAQEVPQTSNYNENEDDDEIFDLTQCDSPNEEDIGKGE